MLFALTIPLLYAHYSHLITHFSSINRALERSPLSSNLPVQPRRATLHFTIITAVATNTDNIIEQNYAADAATVPQPDCDSDQEISEAARMVLCQWVCRFRRRYLARNRRKGEAPSPAPPQGILKKGKDDRELHEAMMEDADFGYDPNKTYYYDLKDGQTSAPSNDGKPAPAPKPSPGPIPSATGNFKPAPGGITDAAKFTPRFKKTPSFTMDPGCGRTTSQNLHLPSTSLPGFVGYDKSSQTATQSLFLTVPVAVF
ncbi:hypothetical protein B0T25DRAFT_552304 [Lasiosphaeria hispida]|uniref:Uncharacterized protein n=1 Tax=Lasiosphaeria hispida TaxID=260671 RepID=A0AAJ0HBJ2_9PEZI|nr:hypothetical protein B0T25DRAFT_552304 [Lasiosphaeria hispida]